MLQKQKDFWKKQAETEYILALNEKEKVKALEETQKGWTQRVNESAWLLQGVEKDTTKLLHKTEEQKAAEEIEAQLKAQAKQVKKEKKSSIFTKVVRILTSERKKREAPKRVRYADLERQEELAKELIEQDERKNRLEFLIESNARLRVLYRVRNWLHVPRMPVHHKPLQQYSDYTPECTNIGKYCFVVVFIDI